MFYLQNCDSISKLNPYKFRIKLSLNWFIPGVCIRLFLGKRVEFSTNNLPHIIYLFLDDMEYI